MSLRNKIESFIASKPWMRNHSEGIQLLKEAGGHDERKIKRLSRDNPSNNSILLHLLEKSLFEIQDEKTVPKEVSFRYIDTPEEVVKLYRLQADLKGKQAALHAQLEQMQQDKERMEAAKLLLEWQLLVDDAWDGIKLWKTSLVLPSEQQKATDNILLIKNKRSYISKLKSKIAKQPNHRLVPEWKVKLQTSESELKILTDGRK